MSKGSQAIQNPLDWKEKRETRNWECFKKKGLHNHALRFSTTITFHFFSKLNLFFSKHFCVRLECNFQFCVWLAVSLFWVSCTRSSQDVLTFQTFLWLLKWRSQIYFLQGLLSNAHSQPLQPINSRGCVTCVFLSLRTALFSGLFIAKTFPFRCQAVNVVK